MTTFSGKYINLNEVTPLTILDGSVIIKITVLKIENIKPEFRHLRYGVLEDQTDVNLKVSKIVQKKLKILSDRVQEKQIFKKNFNF